MIALAALAAIGWGASDFFGGVARGRVLVFSILVVTQLIGAAIIVPALIATGAPPWNTHLLWACAAGVAVTIELGIIYYALSVGAAFITAPVGALGAALAVCAGLISGDPLTPVIALGLLCAVIGGGLSAAGDSGGRGQLSLARSISACLLAAAAVATMQITLHTAGKVNPYWAAELEHLTTATTATVAVAAIVMHRHSSSGHVDRDRLTPALRQLPLLALVALTGAGGDVAYTAASHGALSTVSAIASLYPIPTIALAYALHHRRTRPTQSAGILLALLGAALLGAVSP